MAPFSVEFQCNSAGELPVLEIRHFPSLRAASATPLPYCTSIFRIVVWSWPSWRFLLSAEIIDAIITRAEITDAQSEVDSDPVPQYRTIHQHVDAKSNVQLPNNNRCALCDSCRLTGASTDHLLRDWALTFIPGIE